MNAFRHLAFVTAAIGLAGAAAAATPDASAPAMPAAPAMPPAVAPSAGAPATAVAAPPPAGAKVTAIPAATPSANLLAHHGFVYQTRHKGEDTLGIFQIENSGGTPDVLTAWKCPIADTTTLVNGSGNKLVKQLRIPADGTVKLIADGDHLVLRNIHFQVQVGSVVPCALTFQNAGLVGVMLYSMPDPRHKSTN